jgi:hypothetical protein
LFSMRSGVPITAKRIRIKKGTMQGASFADWTGVNTLNPEAMKLKNADLGTMHLPQKVKRRITDTSSIHSQMRLVSLPNYDLHLQMSMTRLLIFPFLSLCVKETKVISSKSSRGSLVKLVVLTGNTCFR